MAKLVGIPATDAPTPKKALTPEQVVTVLEVAKSDPLVHAFLLVGFTQGLRAGENLGAGWDYLDWEGYTDENGVVTPSSAFPPTTATG